jgi:glutamate-1-semialdehyde 2,1-aminomutase
MSRYSKSKELHERACGSIAGGVNSHLRAHQVPHPLFYSRAAGARVWDADGNEFIDYTLSQGPMILGHSPPAVLDRVNAAMQQGQLFAAQHEAEVTLAEELCDSIPCAELVRLSLSGSEANHVALRLARAVTGRPLFIRFEGHYHGWLDDLAVSVNPTPDQHGPRENPTRVAWSAGQRASALEDCLVLPWNDLDLVRRTLERRAPDIAAVITEPVMCNHGCVPPEPGFLEGLRKLCDQYGVLLIFDEIITGFRLALGGAQEFYGVTPDLATVGKALANGFPISALAGKRKVMELVARGTVMHGGTGNANIMSVAAALATLEQIENAGGEFYKRLFQRGQQLMDGLRAAAKSAGLSVLVQGPGPMFHMGFMSLRRVVDYRATLRYDRAKYNRFCAAMLDRGVWLIGRGFWYVSAAHTEQDIEQTVRAAAEALRKL